MLSKWRKHIFIRWINYLLLLNFINLTANFYHASVIDSSLLMHQDPIDSLAELVLEYIFEMDDETIPDTEVPHEKRKTSDIKLLYLTQKIEDYLLKNRPITPTSYFYSDSFKNRALDHITPPPKLG